MVATFGCALGVVPHMVAAITGLAALLNASAIAFQTLKWLGVAYLLYLAWQTLKDKSPIDTDATAAAMPFWSTVRTAVLINSQNPKLTTFLFAFLPQFVPSTEQAAWLHMIGLSPVFMSVTFIVFALYGVFAAGMRAKVLTRPAVVAWMRRSFAATYVLLAGRLALVQK